MIAVDWVVCACSWRSWRSLSARSNRVACVAASDLGDGVRVYGRGTQAGGEAGEAGTQHRHLLGGSSLTISHPLAPHEHTG